MGLRAEGVVVAGFGVFLCEAAVCRLSSSWASFKGLKERPSKGPLGFYRGFMRLEKGSIRVI